MKSQNVVFPGCLFRYPMQLLLLSTMHNCLIYLWIIKNKRIFKNNYNALNTLVSGALNFLGRPKNHILNVKSQSFRKKILCINVYGNIIFPDFKYVYAYRTIFLGAHFENFVIPIICWKISKTWDFFFATWPSLFRVLEFFKGTNKTNIFFKIKVMQWNFYNFFNIKLFCFHNELIIFYIYLFIFREREKEGSREGEKHWCVRETSIGYPLHAPWWAPGLQPRHVCQPGIKPVAFWFAGHT